MDKNVQKLVAQNLLRLMNRPGKEMNLKELAAKARLNYSTVQRISKAETDVQISNLYALSVALGVTLDEFVSQEDSPPEKQEIIRKINQTAKNLSTPHNWVLLNLANSLLQAEFDLVNNTKPGQPSDDDFIMHRAPPR